MTLLAACRRYNELVGKMLQMAQGGDWDAFFDLDQESRQYSEFIVQQDQQGMKIAEDAGARIFLAEVISYHKEIAKLVAVRRSELRAELSLDILASKLEKLYSG